MMATELIERRIVISTSVLKNASMKPWNTSPTATMATANPPRRSDRSKVARPAAASRVARLAGGDAISCPTT